MIEKAMNTIRIILVRRSESRLSVCFDWLVFDFLLAILTRLLCVWKKHLSLTYRVLRWLPA